MKCCYIALGGNAGPVEQTFDRALADLTAEPRVAIGRRSSVHRTRAVGAHAGPDFLNAAAQIETSLAPLELLDLLIALEDRSGRARNVRWGPRTLDLDLLLYGSDVIDLPRLKVPHPACWYRRFVLDPLCEIAADVVHPGKGLTFGELRDRLLVRPLPVAVAGGEPETRRELVARLSSAFPEVAVDDWHRARCTTDPTLLFWLNRERGGAPEVTRTLSASGSLRTTFDELPVVPRLDVSCAADAAEFVGDVLTAALG